MKLICRLNCLFTVLKMREVRQRVSLLYGRLFAQMQIKAYKTVRFGVVFATRSNKKYIDIVSKCRMVTLK